MSSNVWHTAQSLANARSQPLSLTHLVEAYKQAHPQASDRQAREWSQMELRARGIAEAPDKPAGTFTFHD